MTTVQLPWLWKPNWAVWAVSGPGQAIHTQNHQKHCVFQIFLITNIGKPSIFNFFQIFSNIFQFLLRFSNFPIFWGVLGWAWAWAGPGLGWAWPGHGMARPSPGQNHQKHIVFSNIFHEKYWKTFNFQIFSNISQYVLIFIKVFQFSNILGGLGLGRGLVSRADWVGNLQKHWKIGKP